MSDRTVATDALATLGTIIDDTAKRDAIHLAVLPAIASELLSPGEHVELRGGLACGVDPGTGTGVVDPFLTKTVRIGQRFWLIVYPRTIQSLRHVWSHPAFPDEAQATTPTDKATSEAWLREFVSRSDCPNYELVIGTIADDNFDDEYLHFGSDAHGEIPPEFWDHVEVVLGHKVRARPTYFSCSC